MWFFPIGTRAFPAARLASQRRVPLEGVREGEEEQGARAAPDDLLTSYPGTGRKSALLGRVRTCQGACLVSSPTLAVHGHSASPHPVPASTLGWSVHQPGEVYGLRPPAPVLRGGSRIAAVSSPRRAQENTSRRGRHAPFPYILNYKNLFPLPALMGGALRASSWRRHVILGLVPRIHRAADCLHSRGAPPCAVTGPASSQHAARCRPRSNARRPRNSGSSDQVQDQVRG